MSFGTRAGQSAQGAPRPSQPVTGQSADGPGGRGGPALLGGVWTHPSKDTRPFLVEQSLSPAAAGKPISHLKSALPGKKDRCPSHGRAWLLGWVPRRCSRWLASQPSLWPGPGLPLPTSCTQQELPCRAVAGQCCLWALLSRCFCFWPSCQHWPATEGHQRTPQGF